MNCPNKERVKNFRLDNTIYGVDRALLNGYPEIAAELNHVEEYIRKRVRSKNRLLSEIVRDLVEAGGKRLRPALAIVSAKFGSYDREKVLSVAAALEILHSATLVHDDIIDRAKLRRGRNTVSDKYGIDLAVYTGDFLFTKAVLILSRDLPTDKLDFIASAVKTICEGEVDQYIDKFNVDTTVLSYLKRISKKTAILFAAACGLGAFVSGCSENTSKRLARFGFYYGMAFQLRDDINDFVSSEAAEGKPVAHDLSEGIITLPAIFAAKKDKRVKAAIAAVLAKKTGIDRDEMLSVVQMIEEFKGIDEAKSVMKKYIARGLKQLEVLPDNSYKALLADLIYKLDQF